MRSSLALAAVSLCAAILARASLHGTDTPPPPRVHAPESLRVCAAPGAKASITPLDLTRVRAARAGDCGEWVRVPTLRASLGSVLQPSGVIQLISPSYLIGAR